MVKAKTADINANLKKLNPAFKAVLVYGQDAGLVRERADLISKQVVDNLNDPFNVVSPSLDDIAEHSSLLADELASFSLMGGRRLIRLDNAGDRSAFKAIDIALDTDGGENLLVITAGDLKPTSKLRKTFEASKTALAIPCYADKQSDLQGLIHQMFQDANLQAEPAAIQYLVANLGSDRLVSRSELDKIIMYKLGDDDRMVTLELVTYLIGDSAKLALFDISNAVASGQVKNLDMLLERAMVQGENAIAILRTLQRRLTQLHFVKGLMEEGMSADMAMKKLRPPIFYNEQDIFKGQLYRWTKTRLNQALAIILEAETQCKTTGMPDASIANRVCARLATSAARAAR